MLSKESQSGRTFIRKYPFIVLFLLWGAFAAVQIIPLPPEIIRRLSWETAELYAITLGPKNWAWKPLSLSPYETEQALLHVITVAGLFYLTVVSRPRVDLNTKGVSRDPFFNRLLWVILFAAMFEAYYGIAEYLRGNQHLYFYSRTNAVDGAAGTFVNRNHFANYLVLFFPLLFSWFAIRVRLPRKARQQTGSFPGELILLGAALVGISVAVVCSHSRIGIVSWILSALLLGIGLQGGSESKGATRFLGGLLAVAGLFLIFFDPGFSSLQNRISAFLSGQETRRFQVWQDSLRMVLDFPWTGTGLGSFALIFPKYSSVPITLWFIRAHSDWIQLLVETGIPGFLLVGSGTVWFLLSYLKRVRFLSKTIRPLGYGILISILLFVIHSGVEFNFHIPANAYSFAILTGMGLRLLEETG